MNTAFETKIFAGSSLPGLVYRNTNRSNNFETTIDINQRRGNVLSRLINNFARAINTQRRIPKWVLIIPESNFLDCVNYNQFGISEAYGIAIEYIMSNMDNMIQQFMGHDFPQKANKYNWPYYLWVEPTLHMGYDNNPLRIKFSKSLHIASTMHDRSIVLPLRLMWSDNSPNMIDSINNRLSPAGLTTFWRGIDQLIRFADTKVMRNFGLPLKQIFHKQKLQKEFEQAADLFEKRLAAKRDLTRQLQMNQLVRYFNNHMDREEHGQRRETNRGNAKQNKGCKRRLFKK